MKGMTNEEIDLLVIKYLKLKKKAEKNNSKEDIKELKDYQNFCMIKLRPLVLIRTSKYKQFTNYQDLEQDGFEALLMAFNTYDAKKGSFSYWADKYIKTRISRAANAHSTIKIPIKKARDIKPHKINIMPVMLDMEKNPHDKMEECKETENILEAIDVLPVEQQNVINLTFGFNGRRANSANKVMEHLSINRQEYNKLLNEAKNNIKRHLVDLEKK